MKKRYTDEQMVYVPKQAENGEMITDLCRKIGVSEAIFYNWRKRLGGMGVSEIREIRQLHEENTKREQSVADLSAEKHTLDERHLKKLWSLHASGSSPSG